MRDQGRAQYPGSYRQRPFKYIDGKNPLRLKAYDTMGSQLYMKVAIRFAFLLLGLISAASAQTGIVTLVIETDLGNIEAEVDGAHAPKTVANFLRYVDAGSYSGGMFHRTVKPDNQPNNSVKIEVIQAGRAPSTAEFPPVPLERTSATGILHRDGVLSMARSGPDSAVSDFFICIGEQPSLDFGGKRNADGQGFAAFGRVTKGMDVVRKIQAQPSDAAQHLTPPVKIVRIVRK
jgi:peptidyl-prolyl cis-trans isomerase A (cyclophilin A)